MSKMFYLCNVSDVNIIDLDEDNCDANNHLAVLMNGPNAPKIDARVGDCMRLCENMYRNSSVIILGNRGWGVLDYSLDAYGALPPWFTCPEFPLDHWINIIDHNNR